MLNTSAIMGRLTAKPELRKTSNDKSVVTFTVALDGGRNKKNDERITYWPDCIAWGTTAEFIVKNFDKGQMIAVQGSLQTHTYEDKNKVTHKVTEILVNNVAFCGSKSEVKADTNTNFDPAPKTDDGFEEVGTADDMPF